MTMSDDKGPAAGSSTVDTSAVKRVVTISATYGAGASVVAPKLAERLGLTFFDRLIHNADGQTAATIVERLTDAERDQAPPAGILSSLANLTSVLGLPVPGAEAEPRGQLRRQVETSVQKVAAGTGGVILGRAAAVVLAGAPMCFHVRLTGPVERRLARAMTIEGATEEEVRTRQTDTDKAWSRFVSRLFDKDPADPGLYHLVIDSTALSLEACVELIASGAQAFWSAQSPS
jgi:cytidylate kinase